MDIIAFTRLWLSTLRTIRRDRRAWTAGYRGALAAHRLVSSDADLEAMRRGGGEWGVDDVSWTGGYLACLTAHHLPKTDADRRELAAHSE